jgi:outer membrane receptor protein involved in Fe transport
VVLDYAVTSNLEVGGNLILVSSSYLHGNENNANQAGDTNGAGDVIMGTGTIPGYAVVNLQGTWHLGKSVELFARLVNVFDKEYATAGFLTSNTFNPNGSFRPDPDDWTNENAVSPGTPRAIWAGLRAHFD